MRLGAFQLLCATTSFCSKALRFASIFASWIQARDTCRLSATPTVRYFSDDWHIYITHCRRRTYCGGILKPTWQTPRASQESRLPRINTWREFSLSWMKNLVKRNFCWVTKSALVTISSSRWRFGAKISLDQPRHLHNFCASCSSCLSDQHLKECMRWKTYIWNFNLDVK